MLVLCVMKLKASPSEPAVAVVLRFFAISDQSPLERVFSSMLSSDLMSDADGAVFDVATYD